MQWQKPMAETRFCRTGLNRFKPRFKPPLAETCQPWSAQLSKITNDGLTQFGTGCHIAVRPIWQQVNRYTTRYYEVSQVLRWWRAVLTGWERIRELTRWHDSSCPPTSRHKGTTGPRASYGCLAVGSTRCMSTLSHTVDPDTCTRTSHWTSPMSSIAR